MSVPPPPAEPLRPRDLALLLLASGDLLPRQRARDQQGGVAGAFLDRLFGRRGPLPPEAARALADLDKLAAERPSLAAPAAVLRDALPALFAEPVPFTPPPTLTAEQAATKLAAGVPLLR